MALQIGHRISYDLELFGNRPFTPEEILDLVAGLGPVETSHKTANILILSISEIKGDFVNYRHLPISDLILNDNLRLLNLPYIADMKIGAITGRGRKRDFFDLFFLLRQFSFSEIMNFYSLKYPDGNSWLVAKSIGYFTDADEDEDPVLIEKLSWEKLKKTISQHAITYFR